MAQLAQNNEAQVQEQVQEAVTKTRRKARDQLQLLLEKREREDEIREMLAAFAEEMERARETHDKLF